MNTYAEINLSSIAHNIAEIKKIIGKRTKIMAVVKADAYGHGAVPVSKVALKSDVHYLSVATLAEAKELYDAEITAPILILSESPEAAAEEIVNKNFTQTVYTVSQAVALEKAARKLKKRAIIHIKIDTGMGRIGIQTDEAMDLINKIFALDNLIVEGIFTHFAKADDIADDYTLKQFDKFKKILNEIESRGFKIPIKHAANSAATLFYPQTHMDMIRIGLSLYGLYPGGAPTHIVKLRPALSFKTKVVYLKRVKAGTPISYGCTYVTKKETNIATLGVGYSHGFSRLLSGRAQVLIRGKRFPVVGRVCMDLTLVDCGDADIKIGDEVVLIGSQGKETISAEDIAREMGTINYEIVCGIGKRVPRIYI